MASLSLLRSCQRCSKEFRPYNGQQLFCSTRCRKAALPREMGPTLACAHCGKEFEKRRLAQRHCSQDCRLKAKVEQNHSGRRCYLPTGTVGAIGELRVCIDLMERGYHVFRCVSPHAPCDLIAWRDGGPPLRIEVKTGSVRKDGSWTCSTVGRTRHVMEILAVIIPQAIIYEPALPEG